jgi:hypothetical protein
MIEPSQEFGFRDLERTQRLRRELIDTNFGFNADDLRLTYRLYGLRKKAASAPGAKAQLDSVSRLIAVGSLAAARKNLGQLEAAFPQ